MAVNAGLVVTYYLIPGLRAVVPAWLFATYWVCSIMALSLLLYFPPTWVKYPGLNKTASLSDRLNRYGKRQNIYSIISIVVFGPFIILAAVKENMSLILVLFAAAGMVVVLFVRIRRIRHL